MNCFSKMTKIFAAFLVAATIASALAGCQNNRPDVQENGTQTTVNKESESTDIPAENLLSPTVSTDEAYEIIKVHREDSSFVLLDVRTKGEYDELYIDGSIHRPLAEEDAFLKSVEDITKDKRILIYCRTQNRSHTAYDYLTENGYKHVQYMNGGITQWAKEGKPLVEPFKNGQVSVIQTDRAKHYYKPSENFELSLQIESFKGVTAKIPLYKKTVIYEITDCKNVEVGRGKITTDKNGKADFSLSLKDFKEGKYMISLYVDDADYRNLPTFFEFEVVDKNVNEDIKTYESLKNKGYFSHVLNVNQEMSEALLMHNTFKNLSGFRLKNFAKKDVLIRNILDKRPTLLVFGSPTCGSCTDCWEYISKLDTEKINVLFIVTSIHPDELDSTKDSVIKKLKDRNIDIPEDNIYFDAVDFIWREVMSFTTTPQIVMLNEYREVINFMTNDGSNFTNQQSFEKSLNEVLWKTFGIQVGRKTDLIEITLNLGSTSEKIYIKSGSTLGQVNVPKREMYRFKGFELNGKIISLETHIFENNTTLKAVYEKVAVEQSELASIKNLQLIDVRSEDKFNKGHLDGALWAEENNFKNKFIELQIDKSRIIVVYGSSEPLTLIDYLTASGYKSYYLYDYTDTDNPADKNVTFEEREKNGEFDSYFDNRREKENLRNHYGENYLDFYFTDFNKQKVTLGSKLTKEGKPTIIMVGSTTCGLCASDLNRFFNEEATFEFNFIESVIFSKSYNIEDIINSEKNKIDSKDFDKHLNHRLFDSERLYIDGDHPLAVYELPTYYVLDGNGNLTYVMSSYDKAVAAARQIGDTVSVRG